MPAQLIDVDDDDAYERVYDVCSASNEIALNILTWIQAINANGLNLNKVLRTL